MTDKAFYALVLCLKDKDTSSPKILKASELFKLKSNSEAVPLRPKSATDFHKTKEYGRIVVVDGAKKMVRHIIFALSDDIDKLRSMYDKDKDSKRFVPGKRKSIGPIVEPLDNFKLPKKKSKPAVDRAEDKKLKSKAVKEDGDRILKKHKKNSSTPIKNADKDIPTGNDKAEDTELESKAVKEDGDRILKKHLKNSSTPIKNADNDFPVGYEKMKSSPASQSWKVREDLSKKKFALNDVPSSSTLKSVDAMPNKLDPTWELQTESLPSTVEVHKEKPINIESFTITPDDITNAALTAIGEERHKRKCSFGSTEHDCEYGKELDIVSTKLEKAQLEIGLLKDQILKMEDIITMKNDITDIKDLLQNNFSVGGAVKKPIANEAMKALSNLLVSDDEDVPDDKIKVDHDKYLSKEEVMRVARKATLFTPRLDLLLDIFCDNDPANYSLSGWTSSGKAVNKITDQHVDVLIKILESMPWSAPTTLSKDKVKTRISRYTSAHRNEDTDCGGVEKKLGAAKRKMAAMASKTKIRRVGKKQCPDKISTDPLPMDIQEENEMQSDGNKGKEDPVAEDGEDKQSESMDSSMSSEGLSDEELNVSIPL